MHIRTHGTAFASARAHTAAFASQNRQFGWHLRGGYVLGNSEGYSEGYVLGRSEVYVGAAQEQVHAMAAECLPFLLQRAQEETARQTLLRAASQEAEDGGALLLRPAQGAGAIRPDELLRADLSGTPTPQQPDERA